MGNHNRRKRQCLPIKELYLGLYDGPHATPAPSDSGPVFLGIKNIAEDGSVDLSDTRHIAEEDFPNWTKRVTPRCGDIVFSYEATLHRYALIPPGFRGCLGRRMALIRVNPERCDYKFLYFYLRSSMWRQVIESKQVIGATVDRIPLIKFPDFPVVAPDLETQKKIASILSAYDDLIKNNKRRIAILEKMAEEIYREWFVRMRFPAHAEASEGKTANQIKSVPGCPPGWTVSKLSDIMELCYGKALKEEDRTGGPYPVYGSSGVVGYHSRALVSEAGIVVGRKGNVGSIHWSDEPFFPIDTAYFVRSELPKEYLYFLLHGMNFINNDAAVPGLSRSQAYANQFFLPPTESISRFADLIRPFFQLRKTIKEQVSLLVRTRDLILPRLISGKLSVENVELPSNASPTLVGSALPQQEFAHAQLYL